VLNEVDLALGQRQKVGALRVGEEASAGHRRSRAGGGRLASVSSFTNRLPIGAVMSLVCERREGLFLLGGVQPSATERL
jgi:hypothetical protein